MYSMKEKEYSKGMRKKKAAPKEPISRMRMPTELFMKIHKEAVRLDYKKDWQFLEDTFAKR